MTQNALPFQYALRAHYIESLPQEDKSILLEQRDRELEDYLGNLVLSGGGGGTDEVWIDTSVPTDPDLELWYDPDAAGGIAADEVMVSEIEPSDPTTELWYNPAAEVIPGGTPGPAGPAGPAGETGPAGVGVPAGGTTGQVLAKDTSTDYDTEWIDPPAGGGGVNEVWIGDVEPTDPAVELWYNPIAESPSYQVGYGGGGIMGSSD